MKELLEVMICLCEPEVAGLSYNIYDLEKDSEDKAIISIKYFLQDKKRNIDIDKFKLRLLSKLGHHGNNLEEKSYKKMMVQLYKQSSKNVDSVYWKL